MTQARHTVLEFEPSLVGCMITGANHSNNLIKKSKECVINIPTADLIDKVVGIGNTTGAEIDKFKEFDLTPDKAKKVKAPLIKECMINIECKLYDGALTNKYNFFIFEVLKVHAPKSPKYPKTVHYTGDGVFMVSGKHINHRKSFRRENL